VQLPGQLGLLIDGPLDDEVISEVIEDGASS
jgi:hypothetical protein